MTTGMNTQTAPVLYCMQPRAKTSTTSTYSTHSRENYVDSSSLLPLSSSLFSLMALMPVVPVAAAAACVIYITHMAEGKTVFANRANATNHISDPNSDVCNSAQSTTERDTTQRKANKTGRRHAQ
jgi:hypothetical protein